MYYTTLFKELGGLDCRFMHVNMNAIDLMYRVQKNGGKVLMPDTLVLNCDYDSLTAVLHQPLDSAYSVNDLPLFKDIYDKPFSLTRIKIDYDNWKDTPSVWRSSS